MVYIQMIPFILDDIGTNILIYLLTALSLSELRTKRFLILALLAAIIPTFFDFFNTYLGTFSAIALLALVSAYATWPNYKRGITTTIISVLLTNYTVSFSTYLTLWLLHFKMIGTLSMQQSQLYLIPGTILNYLIALILYWIGKKILDHFHFPDDSVVTNIKFYSVILLFVFYLVLLFSIRSKSYQLTYLSFMMFIIFLLFIVTLIMVYLLVTSHFQQVKAQNEAQQSQNRLLYIQELETDYQKLQNFKHDYKNLLSSVSQSLNNNDTSNETLDILLKYSKFETIDPNKGRLYHLQSASIRNTILTKIMEAKSEKITMDYEIDSNFNVPNDISKKLTTIIQLFLTNAINQCKSIENSNIKMALTKSEKFLEIIIEHDVETSDLQQISQKDSTLVKIRNLIKNDSHYLLQTKLHDKRLTSIITVDCGDK